MNILSSNQNLFTAQKSFFSRQLAFEQFNSYSFLEKILAP